MLALLGFGIIARFAVMTRGYNFDFDSWNIVADIASQGGNVYAETFRYNYGPIWFEVLRIIDSVAAWLPDPQTSFRILIVCLLTLADLGIWFLLRKRFGLIAGFLFFLNPISIIITGYHNQFDNLAILAALAAVMVYGEDKGSLSRRKILGLVLLGLSLAVKHLFFLFPLWLAVRQKGWKEKLVVLAVPLGIFLLSLLPYAIEGHEGMMKNVFGYISFNNAPSWSAVLPQFLQAIVSAKVLFFAVLVVMAFAMRKRPLIEAVLIYTIVLVVFSPAIANQYLAIVCAAIAVFPNALFGLYALLSTLMLAMSGAGLHSATLKDKLPEPLSNPLTAETTFRAYDLPILALGAGLLWYFQRKNITTGAKKIINWAGSEIRHQLESFRR